MEKISKEELLEKLGLQGLSDEDLEKVVGGEEDWSGEIDESKIDVECMKKCMKSFKDLYKCMKQCVID